MKRKTLIIFTVCVATLSYLTGHAIGSGARVELDQPPDEPPVEVVEEEPCQIPPEEDVVEVESETYTITAYCSCHECCGKWANDRPVDENGQTIVYGSGCVPLVQGVHCASALANGTVVEIEGFGIYEVQDSVSQKVLERYDDKIIDIYFSNHEEAESFGKYEREVKILYGE